jgi:serine/threonine protein kinase
MEYVDGPDLQQLMHARPFPAEIGLMVLLQAAKGLSYAHARQTIHCDIKPSNILVSKTGKAKVLDFGLARVVTHTSDLDSSSVFITPGYMAPEVAVGNRNLDSKVDIWSIGVLAYRIVTGRLPFISTDVRQLVYSIVHDAQPSVKSLAPSVRNDLADAIELCLQKEPDKRPGTLEPFVEVLSNYIFDLRIRDSEKELEKFIADKKASSAQLYDVIANYNLRIKNESSSGKSVFKSETYFQDPRKYRIRENQAKITSPAQVAPANMFPAGRIFPVRIPKLPIPKLHRQWKTIAAIVGIVCLVSLGTATALMFSQKHPDEPQRISQAPAIDKNATGPKDAAPAQPAQVTRDTDNAVRAGYAALGHSLTAVIDTPSVTRNVASRKAISPPVERRIIPQHTTTGTGFGIVKLQLEPSRALVFLDGKQTTAAEFSNGKKVAAGSHALYVVADGFSAYNNFVSVGENATEVVSISLKQLERGSGKLHVYSYPWADLYVDGSFIGPTPTPKPIALAEGDHSLVLKRDGFKDHAETVHVVAGDTAHVKVQLER